MSGFPKATNYWHIFCRRDFVSHILATFSRKPVFGYLGMVYAMLSIGILGLMRCFLLILVLILPQLL